MYNIKELEERWIYYKVKQALVPTIKVSALYLVTTGAYYFYDKNDDIVLNPHATKVLGVMVEANDTVMGKEIVKTTAIVESEQLSIKKDKKREEEKIVLSPIIPVIDMEKEEKIVETEKKYVKKHKYNKSYHSSKVKHTVKAKKNSYLTAKELAVVSQPSKHVVVTPPRKTKKMNFTSTSTNYIELMKQKFAKSNSPRDALLLANTYYKKNNYTEAEQWALSANKLNNSLEESWLLFAKSKAKLGKKKEALKILVSYYKKSNSIKAKRLIGQIQTGRI